MEKIMDKLFGFLLISVSMASLMISSFIMVCITYGLWKGYIPISVFYSTLLLANFGTYFPMRVLFDECTDYKYANLEEHQRIEYEL